jgi:hypothetical protein
MGSGDNCIMYGLMVYTVLVMLGDIFRGSVDSCVMWG